MSNKKFYADDEKSKIIARNSASGKKKLRKTSKVLNKTFAEKKIVKSESNLKEAAMNIKRFELERSSTPNQFNLCEHCKHNHAQECCMYVYDDHSDIMKYSQFKESVDENYWTMESDEDFGLKIGNSTPIGFPAYSESNANVADLKLLSNFNQPPVVYLRQYFWPILMPTIYQPPIQNMNFYQNPENMKFIPQMMYPNYMPPPPQAQPYMPCVMRQVPIPVQYNYQHNPSNFHQVIESHNYVPVNYYFGTGIGGGNLV